MKAKRLALDSVLEVAVVVNRQYTLEELGYSYSQNKFLKSIYQGEIPMYSESDLLIATMGQVEIYLDKAKCDADDKRAVEMLKQKALGAFAVWQFFHPDDLNSQDFQEFESLIMDFDSLPPK